MVVAQELCESRGGRPGLPVPNKPTVSVDVKQHSTMSPVCIRMQKRSYTHVKVPVVHVWVLRIKESKKIAQQRVN